MYGRVYLLTLLALTTGAWGPRGHQSANRAAVKSLPADGPVFLKEHEEWIDQVVCRISHALSNR